MINPINKKPLIGQGWLRVLIFSLCYYASFFVIAIPVGLLIGLGKKENDAKGIQQDLSSLMNGDYLWLTILAGLVIALVLVTVFRKFVDRKSITSLGFQTKGFHNNAISGFFLAPAMLGTGALILFLTHHLQWTNVDFNPSSLFISFGIFVMVALSEEIVFRGYMLNNLMESFNKWIALTISAILFTLFHLGAPGMGFIALANIFLAGILLGINYIYTKNLWFALLMHLAWNFFQGPILGFKVSGIALQTLLQAELKGDLLLTGGEFGFEGSFFDTAITLVAILIIYLVYEKKYKPDVQLV